MSIKSGMEAVGDVFFFLSAAGTWEARTVAAACVFS